MRLRTVTSDFDTWYYACQNILRHLELKYEFLIETIVHIIRKTDQVKKTHQKYYIIFIQILFDCLCNFLTVVVAHLEF